MTAQQAKRRSRRQNQDALRLLGSADHCSSFTDVWGKYIIHLSMRLSFPRLLIASPARSGFTQHTFLPYSLEVRSQKGAAGAHVQVCAGLSSLSRLWGTCFQLPEAPAFLARGPSLSPKHTAVAFAGLITPLFSKFDPVASVL